MKKLVSAFVAFAREDEGLTMVEYAVAGAVITAAAAAAFTALGGSVSAQITAIQGIVDGIQR